MVDKLVDFAQTTLASPINTTDDPATFSVAGGEGAEFALAAGETMLVSVCKSDGTNLEILRLTARSVDSLTATRAVEAPAGKSAVKLAHGVGEIVSATITAGTMQAIQGFAPIVIPGSDPTGAADSLAAFQAFGTQIAAAPPGSYFKIAPGRYKIASPRAGQSADWHFPPNSTMDTYGVSIFQDQFVDVHANDAPLFSVSGNNCTWRGGEIFGYKYNDNTVSNVIQGTASAGSFINAPSGGLADATRLSQAAFFARNVDGDCTLRANLSSANGAAPTIIGGSDVLIVWSQSANDIDCPDEGPTIVDYGSGTSGPTANHDYWYAVSKIMSDFRETGLGPITYYRSGGVRHPVVVSNLPTPEGTIDSGVMTFAIYRCAGDPTNLDNWKSVGSAPRDLTSFIDFANDADLSNADSPPAYTTFFAPGTLGTTPTQYIAAHAIVDDDQQISAWAQRISPSNGNTVSITGSVRLIGKPGFNGSGAAQVAPQQSAMQLGGLNTKRFVFQDLHIEGFNDDAIKGSGQFEVELDHVYFRAFAEQCFASAKGINVIIRDSILGESGLSCVDIENDGNDGGLVESTITNSVIRNWNGVAYGLHIDSNARRMRLNGAIFKTFGGGDPIGGGSTTGMIGDAKILSTKYIPRPTGARAALLTAGTGDLDLQIEGYDLLTLNDIQQPAPGLNTGASLPGGGNDIQYATAVNGSPTVITMHLAATDAPRFGVGDFALTTAKKWDPQTGLPYNMIITGATWSGGTVTLTVTPHTTTLAAPIAAGSPGDTVTVTVATPSPQNEIFPIAMWGGRTDFMHEFYVDSECFQVTAKSGGTQNPTTWTCIRGAHGTSAAAHSSGATVSMATAQRNGDTMVVAFINPAGYNGAFTQTAFGPNTVQYALASNPGAYVPGGPVDYIVGAAGTPPTAPNGWNGNDWIVTALSGNVLGATYTLNPIHNSATKLFPSPVGTGGHIGQIAYIPTTTHMMVRASMVLRPSGTPGNNVNTLIAEAPNSRVTIRRDDGFDLEFAVDSAGQIFQTGYVGDFSGTPPAGAYPYAKGAWAADTAASRIRMCTVAGTSGSPQGTWKSVVLA